MNEKRFHLTHLLGGGLQALLLWFAIWLPAWADSEIKLHTGIVSEVQLVDVTALGDEAFLILSLEEGASYLIPGQRQIAASAGVKVAIRYLPPAQDNELGQACTIQVLGLPVILDGEEVLQLAQRPFEVYLNDNPECIPERGQAD